MNSEDAPADLDWLAGRVADSLGGTVDEVARANGLRDRRDWLVLALVRQDAGRTQLDLATELGIDKTTLMSIIDRLEGAGLLVRRVAPHDRRARIPTLTAEGRRVHDQVQNARSKALAGRLGALPEADRARLHALLWKVLGEDGGS